MTTITHVDLDYKIETLQTKHVKSAAELFTKSFCNSEPVTKYLGIQPTDFSSFATEVMQKADKDGMSKVAVDRSGKVVACAIAEDICDPFIPKFSHYPKMEQVFALLHTLSDPFLKGKHFVKGKVAHVWIAIVDPAYRHHGLSTKIDLACGELAAKKGYDFVYAEFTNPISERIVNQYNLHELCSKVDYKTFECHGQRILEDLEGSASSYIVVIRPGVKLESFKNCYTTGDNH